MCGFDYWYIAVLYVLKNLDAFMCMVFIAESFSHTSCTSITYAMIREQKTMNL